MWSLLGGGGCAKQESESAIGAHSLCSTECESNQEQLQRLLLPNFEYGKVFLPPQVLGAVFITQRRDPLLTEGVYFHAAIYFDLAPKTLIFGSC